MKRVVFLNDLKESEIRPEKIYNEYKDRLSSDIKQFFPDQSSLLEIDCPGCLENENKFVFSRIGFNYNKCGRCGTLFVSPRPTDDALRNFYENSDAGIFLRKTFLNDTMEFRSKKVFSYNIQWITGIIEEYLPDTKIFLDYNTRYPTFLKQLNETNSFDSIISVLPECYGQEDMLPRNARIVWDDNIEENSVDIFAAFEVVEKIFSPAKLFSTAYKACKKNGLFLITSAVSTGFEYLVLGEHSPNIIFPDRINLLSLEALITRIEKAGFKIIEISTPGRLDVEMVKNTYKKNPGIPLDPFWKYFFDNRDENAVHSLQEYLQQFQLSSHVRIAAVKK